MKRARFNIGFGAPTSVNELAGLNLEIIYDKPRSGDIKNSFANISKAKKLLGYNPQFSLKDGLRILYSEETKLRIETEVHAEI